MTNEPTPRSPRRANILAVLVIVIAILGVLAWRQSQSSAPVERPTEAAPVSGVGSRETQLRATLAALTKAWSVHNEARFVAAAGATARSHIWARAAYDNLATLHVERFGTRLVAEDPAGIQPDGAFDADVEVSWTPGKASGLTPTATKAATVKMRFRPSPEGYSLEGVSPGKGPEPLWLVGVLDVRRHGRTHVVLIDQGMHGKNSVNPEYRRLTSMSTRAVSAVRQVLEKKTGPIMIVAPKTLAQTSALLGLDQDQLAQIAAVTSTVDGSKSKSAPVYVVLNPNVFADMGRRATQIVLSHEFTHALTGATAARMPLWVAEGFADYVALRSDRQPVPKSASQIIARVRKRGKAPKHLPDAADFGTTQHGLGATYESAWLIFEVLHYRHPDEQIVAFYRAVRNGVGAPKALRQHLGLTIDSLTQQWRAYLIQLAA